MIKRLAGKLYFCVFAVDPLSFSQLFHRQMLMGSICIYILRDIDECTAYAEYDYDENRSVSKSICSHECINTIGSYICKCPEKYHLLDDKQRCERDFCRHLGDLSLNKTKCSHDCVDEADGWHCKCPDGMELQNDGKTCVEELDLCAISGERCLPGNCINNGSSFYCDCPDGFASHNQR